MGQQVCMGAMIRCNFGLAPVPMVVLPLNRVMSPMPAANIMDNKPLLNIMPFGACRSMMNPMVIAATAAALGVPTPAPCLPMTFIPWLPGSPLVHVGNMPTLNNSSKLLCIWGGMIGVDAPGQFTVLVP